MSATNKRENMDSSCTLKTKTQFFILVSLLHAFNHPTCADPPYYNCSSNPNSIHNTAFHDVNLLQTLFSSLTTAASTLTFAETSIPNDKDGRIYGNFLCYSTISLEDCQDCIKTASDDIQRLCNNHMEATVWEENCQLRYSNQKISGIMDYTTDLPLWNKQNYTHPNNFRVVVRGLLDSLSRKQSSNNGSVHGEQNLTMTETVYGLAQCTRDLSGDNCSICLEKAISHIQSCCYFYRGARVYSRNCYLRYELYPLVPATTPGSMPYPLVPATATGSMLKKNKKPSSVVVISTVAALVVVVTILCSWICYCVCRKETQEEEAPTEVFIHDDVTHASNLPLIRLAIIQGITNHFSEFNVLGKGGFGPVYKGVLPDGKEVAVKRLAVTSEQGSEEFLNEIMLIMKLQHKNLVKLLGCCNEKEEKILVYEYMSNKSLDSFIFDSGRRVLLDWRKRYHIIVGIARGLLYLHQDSRLRIIHRDLKASNILLDDNLNPKISDFGMARLFGGNMAEASTNIIVGTYGYMAPEYAMDGLYSTKSDVYSFGVLLIEIITGKRNAAQRAPSLLSYAWKFWNEGKELELMDSSLTESCLTTEFSRCIHIGLLCAQEEPTKRPKMSAVVVMLGNECVPLPQLKQPAFPVRRLAVQSEQPLDYSINNLTISTLLPR